MSSRSLNINAEKIDHFAQKERAKARAKNAAPAKVRGRGFSRPLVHIQHGGRAGNNTQRGRPRAADATAEQFDDADWLTECDVNHREYRREN